MGIELKSIGVIHSPYMTKEETPIQGVFRPAVTGWVELLPEYADGLKDIEMFSHIYLIYFFDRSGPVHLVRPMLLDDQPHGVFASRYPARPSGIGLTIVQFIKREANRLEIAGIDVLDGTPLLDIKPYVRRFDLFPDACEGWFSGKTDRPKPSGRE